MREPDGTAVVGARARGRGAAEEKLLAAAMDLLAEAGPLQTSVRMVADRAGVNHGLVHHYFGGKDALLAEAMRRLVREHHDYAGSHVIAGVVPEPLMLGGDMRYLRAVVRCVLDGEIGLARTEIDEDVSVPRRALRALGAGGEPSADAKARFMLAMAAEMGWSALEPFLFAVADVAPAEEEAVRTAAQQIRRRRIAAALGARSERGG